MGRMLNGIFVSPAGLHSPDGSAVLGPCGHDKSPKVWKERDSQLISVIALLFEDLDKGIVGFLPKQSSFQCLPLPPGQSWRGDGNVQEPQLLVAQGQRVLHM